MGKIVLDGLKTLSTPLVREFPFIIVFMIMMGAGYAFWDTGCIFHAYGLESLHDEYASPLLNKYVMSFFIWFLVGYLLAALMTKWNHWWVKAPIYITVFVFFAIQFFLKDNFSLPISPSYLMLVAETNDKESSEFLSEYVFSSHILTTLACVVALVVLLLVLRRFWKFFLHRFNAHFGKRKSAIKLGLGILLVPMFILGIDSSMVYMRMAQCDSLERLRLMVKPDDPFSCLFSSALFLNKVGSAMEHAKEVTFRHRAVSLSDNLEDSLNVVLVIGESYIKQHSQLYGYYLNTTPRMMQEQKNGNLFVFNDVVSPYNLTSDVLKNLFSCNNMGNGEPWYESPFFPALFRDAGYNVYMWDNQKSFNAHVDYTFALNSFLFCKEFEEMVYTATNKESFNYDDELLRDFSEKVDLRQTRNVVILHLMGQHQMAKQRFPHTEENMHFTADSIRDTNDFLNQSKKTTIAYYDNATRYNDAVMEQIFQKFSSSNSIVFYFSDHGDEIYDFRDRIGREHGALFNKKVEYEYQVPFVIWCSDTFMDKHPDTMDAIRGAVNKPFMLDNLCHMLFHIGGMSTPDYREEYDLLSPAYQCNSRLLEGYWDYDSHFPKTSNLAD